MFYHLKLTFVLLLFMRPFLESHAASDICSICKCEYSKTTIDCSSRGLTSVPQPIPPNVQSLDLNSNSIENIQSDTFQNLSSLMTLVLENNNIVKIEVNIFRDLPSLMTLLLNDNNIETIEKGAIRDLPSLMTLFLHNNNIGNIAVSALHNLPRLITLFLHNNNIRKLGVRAIHDLPNLKTIFCTIIISNQISQPPPSTSRNDLGEDIKPQVSLLYADIEGINDEVYKRDLIDVEDRINTPGGNELPTYDLPGAPRDKKNICYNALPCRIQGAPRYCGSSWIADIFVARRQNNTLDI
ncbi:leucine-rich repeat-containing protein 4-like [Octopus sinensis]|uniref:Leucine-rich repeat-containing protein 4-like n=1 Tax=Octopus sinensis TaxID=2607531 RepID=A0A7E6EZN1_9MOLL|nr:leucine-rich repeat-containing protein 4-like [Octopus sinensis]